MEAIFPARVLMSYVGDEEVDDEVDDAAYAGDTASTRAIPSANRTTDPRSLMAFLTSPQD